MLDGQAGAKAMVAAFESISDSITSTNDLIGDLVGNLADVGRGPGSAKIKQIIDEQLDIQREQLDLQKELTGAQIDYLREITKNLAGGDALITINGDGLEPELEAFMFRILERIQVTANAQGQQFLLGLPTAAA